MTWPVAGPDYVIFRLPLPSDPAFHPVPRGGRFGASWGSPIVAAADGQVAAAGWAGGYGREVGSRIRGV